MAKLAREKEDKFQSNHPMTTEPQLPNCAPCSKTSPKVLYITLFPTDVPKALRRRDVFGRGGPPDADEGQPDQDGEEQADLQEGGRDHGLRRIGGGTRGPGNIRIWSPSFQTEGLHWMSDDS